MQNTPCAVTADITLECQHRSPSAGSSLSLFAHVTSFFSSNEKPPGLLDTSATKVCSAASAEAVSGLQWQGASRDMGTSKCVSGHASRGAGNSSDCAGHARALRGSVTGNDKQDVGSGTR